MHTRITKFAPILKKEGAATILLESILTPPLQERIIIPFIRLRAGTGGDTLTVRHVLKHVVFSKNTAGTTLPLTESLEDVLNKRAIIRSDDGSVLSRTITAQTDVLLTFNEDVGALQKAHLYIMAEDTDEEVQVFSAGDGQTVLSNDNGFTCSKEMGYPIILSMVNTDGESCIEGGVLAFSAV